ncbi:MAG TPA: hypothetical protein VFF63_00315 [Candidatus Babeliales bacterium]|nr:hypothetical protein [Candidatus Babeliales bacterium]
MAATRPRAVRRGTSASVTVGPWPGAAASVLPMALTRFVGRTAELDEIVALVSEHRLVTLTDSGGVGKTQTTTYPRAARVLGFAEARLDSTGAAERLAEETALQRDRLYERVVTALRELLDADAVVKLMAEGAAMTEDQAVRRNARCGGVFTMWLARARSIACP